jgi:hypothetical protein
MRPAMSEAVHAELSRLHAMALDDAQPVGNHEIFQALVLRLLQDEVRSKGSDLARRFTSCW